MRFFVMNRTAGIGGGFFPVGGPPFQPIEAENLLEAAVSFYGGVHRKGFQYDQSLGRDGTPEKPFWGAGTSDIAVVPANTRIQYLYRDAGNYKQYHEVIVAGELEWKDIAGCLDEGNLFIPSQIGLEDIQLMWEEKGFAFPTEDDHVWCEIEEDGIDYTFLPPTVDVTAQQLVEQFQFVQKWDVAEAAKRLGL